MIKDYKFKLVDKKDKKENENLINKTNFKFFYGGYSTKKDEI